MKEVNGNTYSRFSMNDYKLRIIVELMDKEGITHRMDLYTTQENKDLAWNDISDLISDKVRTYKIVHYATKEQDDIDKEYIEELLLSL